MNLLAPYMQKLVIKFDQNNQKDVPDVLERGTCAADGDAELAELIGLAMSR